MERIAELVRKKKQASTAASRKKVVEKARYEAASITDVLPMPCLLPRFSGQRVIEVPSTVWLDPSNCILLMHDALGPTELAAYIKESVKVPRVSGRSGFGVKPRRELCYSPDGAPYVYSRVAHPTTQYPFYVLLAMRIFEKRINEELAKCPSPVENPYTNPSSGVDIIYDAEFPRGGSIGRHKDDEDAWGMVFIFSLGQTRYLRIRSDATKEWFNVKMTHNSLVVMHGPTFQKKYSHQVDKLKEEEPVGVRLSLNVRYKA